MQQASLSGATLSHKSMNFDQFLSKLKQYVDDTSMTPVFKTDITGDQLVEAYLNSFPTSVDRQEHNCRCCLQFLRNYGGLVVLNHNFQPVSLLWRGSSFGEFQPIVDKMRTLVESSKVSGVFYSDTSRLGIQKAGGWSHFNVLTPGQSLNRNKLVSDSQLSAEKLEHFGILSRAFDRYSADTARKAVSLLEAGSLYRAEKVLGMAKWFNQLRSSISTTRNVKLLNNQVWAAVASAPPGFCNVNGSMLGSLMDDIQANLAHDNIAARFAAKMDPTIHNRPQTAPGAQNVKRAEEIIDKLGIKASFKRRYARLSDLKLEWSPTPAKPVKPQASSGMFKDVNVKGGKPASTVPRLVESTAPAVKMTYSKFRRTVLPNAIDISVLVPARGHFAALVTATNSSAPCILQWGNNVSWYVYSGGSDASKWNLRPKQYARLTGICLQPNMWENEASHQGTGVHFLIEGCRDQSTPGLALFPEILMSSLHGVRKTIEEFCKGEKISAAATGNASGLKFTDNSTPVTLKVTSKDNIISTYVIDRFE